MAAHIRSTVNGVDPIDNGSRNDLEIGDIVVVSSIDAATTYSWSLVYAPENSIAGFSGSATSISPGQFTVDKPGPYLVRLIVDAGLPTEDTQYVRLRALTQTVDLYLVAAGEKRDNTGIIPVDASSVGWANDQNRNLLNLLASIKPFTYSSNILWVDTSDSKADFGSIQAAINEAVSQTPSSSNPWFILVRPGTYTENLTFAPWVHVIAEPMDTAISLAESDLTPTVTIVGTHTLATTGTNATVLQGLNLTCPSNTTSACLTKTGTGVLKLVRCRLAVTGTHASQGAALQITAGYVLVDTCQLTMTTSGGNRYAYTQDGGASTVLIQNSRIYGPRIAAINSSMGPSVNTTFNSCTLEHTNGGVYTDALACVFNYTNVTGTGTSVSVHPGGAFFANDVAVKCHFSQFDGAIRFDIAGITGTPSLELSSVIYGSLVYPSGNPTVTSNLQGTSLYYNNAISGLVSDNVQDAIDEVSWSTRNVSSTPDSPTNQDHCLMVSNTPMIFYLPLASSITHPLVIKDITGMAGSVPIVVTAHAGEAIDGAASKTIVTNYGVMRILPFNNNWYTI